MEQHKSSELMKVQEIFFQERNKLNFTAGKTFKILGHYFPYCKLWS
jgi:hypothetical protein